MILFIDTETTGLPTRYAAIGNQPYVVQIAALLCDSARSPIAGLNHLIRPDGWVIPLEATAIHGITTEQCRIGGVPLSVAMADVVALWSRATRVVSYNIEFDQSMLELSAQRVKTLLPPRDLYCAMRETAKLLNANGRWVNLQTAYRCFFGHPFENAHNAVADVEACKAIYYALVDAVAPVSDLVGDLRTMTAASLRRALEGAGEVHEHQELIDSLIHLHCAPLQPVDWSAIASEPMPERPARSVDSEAAAVQRLRNYRPGWFARLLSLDHDHIQQLQADVERARAQDQRRYETALTVYELNASAVKRRREIAGRILAGDHATYLDVMGEVNLCASPLVGREVIYSIPSPAAAEVFAYLNPSTLIPEETKSLLSSGRVSVKKRSKKDFLHLYQEHVCSAAIRLGRDFMARLPVKRVLLHGLVPRTDATTGQPSERCVLSCLFTREGMRKVQFDKIEPSACVSSFRCAVKFSRSGLDEVAPLSLDSTQSLVPTN